MSNGPVTETFRDQLIRMKALASWETYALGRARAEIGPVKDWWSHAAASPNAIHRMDNQQDLIDEFWAEVASGAPSSQAAPNQALQAVNMPTGDKMAEILEFLEKRGKPHHPILPDVLGSLLTGNPVYIWGPAGSGKSTLAQDVADCLGGIQGLTISFHGMVCGPNISEFDFIAKAMPKGAEDVPEVEEVLPKGQKAEGWLKKLASTCLKIFSRLGGIRVINSTVINGYKKGHALAFIDEVDLGEPAAVKTLNPFLEGDWIYNTATGEMLAKPEHLYFICAGNTNLLGPTEEYRASNAQDQSFISRFATAIYFMDYDEGLEKRILHPKVAQWLSRARKAVKDKGVPVELSTRLGVKMTKALESGYTTWERLLDNWLKAQDYSAEDQLKGIR